MQEKHMMKLLKIYPTGVEEWLCPTCGHKMVLQWEPYKRLVLVLGDNDAIHACGKGMSMDVVVDEGEDE